MNIQALNASPTLGRRQVPRNNNVSFSGSPKIKTGNLGETGRNVSGAFRTLGGRIRVGTSFIAQKVVKGAKASVDFLKRAFQNARNGLGTFVAKSKKFNKIKIFATALTAIVAGGFAIKEVNDIVTKSNPER